MTPTLTPQDIVQAVPTVTLQAAPLNLDCGWWDSVNVAIANNPLIAAAVLSLAAFVVLKRR